MISMVEEEENEAHNLYFGNDEEDDNVADKDEPGVTISFVALSQSLLETCLASPTSENQYNLLQNLDTVRRFIRDPGKKCSWISDL